MRKIYTLMIVGFVMSLAITPVFAQVGVFDKLVDWPQIGDNKVAGSATFADGIYTLEGNGNDIWDSADEGLFIYTEKTGDVSISARVSWVDPGTSDWSKIGVMFRENGDDPASKSYYAILRGAQFGDRADAAWRDATGGASASVQMFEDPPDNQLAVEAGVEGLWLRISRLASANVMVTEYSFDGNNWVVGHIKENTVLADPIAVGLAITNHEDDTNLAVAEVGDVQIGTPQIQLAIARRSLPTSVLPDNGGKISGIKVSVTVVPEGASTSGKVTEFLPGGVTASNIQTTNGSASVSGSNIVWNLSNASGTVEMTYDLDIPAAAAEPGFIEILGEIDAAGRVADTAGVGSLFKVFWTVPFVDRDATLDGVLSPGEYEGAREEKFGHEDGDTDPPGVHITGNAYPVDEENVDFFIYHNAQFIYVALDVTDGDILDFESGGSDPTGSNVWQNDSAEIYFDGNLSRDPAPKSRDRFGFQATVLGDGTLRAGDDGDNRPSVPTEPLANGGYASLDGLYWNYGARVKDDQSGYIVEYQVIKSQILDPPERTVVGFDILMNSADGSGGRSGKWGYWTTALDGTPGEYWDGEDGWAVVELVGGPQSVPDWTLY